VNLKKAEFVCTCWIANIEAESNVTACRDEDEKNKVQAESA
jgi:hypothetical protein